MQNDKIKFKHVERKKNEEIQTIVFLGQKKMNKEKGHEREFKQLERYNSSPRFNLILVTIGSK